MERLYEKYKEYLPEGPSTNLFHFPNKQMDQQNESNIPRRSPRMNKLKNRYGFPPVGPEFRRILNQPKITKTVREREEAMQSVRTLSGPYDGFGFTAKQINDCEVSEIRRITLQVQPQIFTSKECQLVEKYTAEGLDKEAVELGVLMYFNKETLVREFVDGFTALRELGYSKCEAGEALITCDRGLDRALAYLKKGLGNVMNPNVTYQSLEATAK